MPLWIRLYTILGNLCEMKLIIWPVEEVNFISLYTPEKFFCGRLSIEEKKSLCTRPTKKWFTSLTMRF